MAPRSLSAKVVVTLLAGGVAITLVPVGQTQVPASSRNEPHYKIHDESLCRINVDGSSRVQLVTQTDVLDMSPDRAKVLLGRSADDGLTRILVVRQLSTGVEKVLATMPYEIATASWSPDGRMIAFDVVNTSWCIPPAVGCAVWDTWLIRPDGTDLHEFAPAGRWPIWSPGSQRLAFAGRYDVFAGEGVLTVGDAQTGRQRTIGRPGPMLGPTWSRKRGLISYVAAWGEDSSVEAIRVVGVDRRFARTAPPGLDVAWAPSGKTLAVVRTAPHRRLSLVLLDPRTGRSRRVLTVDTLGRPAWSPK